MMNSFYNGVLGAKSTSFGIDVSANNIANVNTTGFKYSDAQFKDIFYTTVTTQSTNPAQGGYGSGVASSQLVFEQGSAVASEGEFDVALQGKGFFGVLGADGNAYYTRNGAFRRDAEGFLVDSYGNFVLGTMNPAFTGINYSDRVAGLMGDYLNTGVSVNSGFTVNSNDPFSMGTAASQGAIKVPLNMYLAPQVTQNVKWSGSLSTNTKTEVLTLDLDPNKFNITKTADGKYIVSGSVSKEEVFSAKAGDRIVLNFVDGNGVKIDFETTLDENLNFKSNELDLKGLDQASIKLDTVQIATEQQKANKDILESAIYNADGSKSTLRITLERILPQEGDNIQYKAIAQIYDFNGNAIGSASEGSVVFNEQGALLENNITSITNPNGGKINIDLGSVYDANKPGSGYNGIYVKEGFANNIVTKQDGVAEGFFSQYHIADDGSIVAQFSNGRNVIVGKLALYNFINEQGLAAMGDNIFASTANSGDANFIFKDGKVINTAQFKGGYLEQSNVDLAVELSNLIVTQKAFDANSKSITTSDQMIQKAINMKR
ncbi:flagellar hook-basal body complex protein [Campylobacter sp. VicNov18]|uniref:flagellar hook-basal body complex protein n=1 Tax=Campylobacter bilis TaxID=2691918 RepID=UPI00130E29D6|nr:flagellar hook-basal body complex protein [Campylobacter bilis]MPV63080.1 flagellar hook-basal body complex protein [Campylobacter hepaticus]MBM0636579.1 flagellar hook-basal body complex protein [Campylobacter bilis]MCC8277287.1 flagellar hook-basal body complex protein [Campylobacter bilis]MCC8299030.1 flagellar hook-basal body complex protein [Campylobacter bilis]MCC8300196.1 flagellar hook-basal body complex protein [Campylobacter bilis]